MDSTFVVYTNLPLSYIPANPGDNLETILIAINTALNNSSSAPDLSGYNLYCLRDECTINTLQDFAECISNYVCTTKADFDSFISTVYEPAISVLQVAIAGLQMPALTYVPFGIVNTDSLPAVYAKLFAGFDAMILQSDPSLASWADISVDPTTIHTAADAANVFIGMFASLEPTISSLSELLPLNGPYDNSANCLTGGGGTNTDNADATIRLLTSYACSLPSYTSSDIETTCLFNSGTLQGDIQLLFSYIDTSTPLSAGLWGAGLTFTPGSGCTSGTLEIDTTWAGLYTVLASGSDTTPGHLSDKLISTNSTIEYVALGDFLSIDVAPALVAKLGKVYASGSDHTDPGFLIDKLQGGSNDWGMSVLITPSGDNSTVTITPVISDRKVFISNVMSNILDDEDLLAQWCALRDACNGCLCSTIDDLLVAPASTGEFNLSWTPAGGTTSAQISKYRARDMSSWLTGNSTPSNPMTDMVNSSVTAGLLGNVVYQFQVDSDCPGDVGHSNIYEMITYTCQDIAITVVDAGGGLQQITGTLLPLSTVDNVEFKLVNTTGPVTVENIITTGINPIAIFTPVSSGTYRIKWRYATLINGVTLYSDDPSQINDYCDTGTDVIVP